MSKIKLILGTTRESLAAARNGDPGPCTESAVQAAEVVERVLELVLLCDATPERVEVALNELWRKW